MPLAHRSLWDDTLPDTERTRSDPLDGDHEADVVVVGAGYTGLWTAYYLARADPTVSIVVLDRHTVGHGASGRNGGWCSALLPTSLTTMAHRHGRPAAIRMARALQDTVIEVERVARAEGIGCDLARGGTLDLARNEAQVERARARLAEYREFGFDERDHRWLDPGEVAARAGFSRVSGALFTPHCAAVHPARLVHGLAALVSRLGVRIHEHTEVTEIGPHRVRTLTGTVRATTVVRATEAYTATLPGSRRSLVPLYSMMIATEPLDDDRWNALGLTARPTFADHRHTIIYGQRTADGRLAFGGRGAPYHFGSAIEPWFDQDDAVRHRLHETLVELLPALEGARVTHHWGGPLGVPRDLQCSVTFDRATGLATAGGYVGDGVATSNLAGRTLADLIIGHDSELTRLPWVGHSSRRWEPEPLRWLGINAVRSAAAAADRAEARTGRGGSLGERITQLLWRH